MHGALVSTIIYAISKNVLIKLLNSVHVIPPRTSGWIIGVGLLGNSPTVSGHSDLG